MSTDDKVDRMLDNVETVLLKAAGERGIVGVNITRWRWDQPDITLTWVAGEVGRSLHVMVKDDENLEVDVSAWTDRDEPGGRRIRQWVSQQLGSTSLARLPASLDDGLNTVVAWSADSLIERYVVQGASPRGQ